MATYNFDQMVEAIKTKLGEASIRFTIETHPVFTPGVIFRFPDDPGEGDFFVAPYSEVHCLLGREDCLEAESYQFPWDGGDVTTFFLPGELDDLIEKVVGYLGGA